MLCAASVLLMISFFFWTSHQEKRGKPALIPYSIWGNSSFTTACLLMLISNAVLNSVEVFSSLLSAPSAVLSRFITNDIQLPKGTATLRH